ncbi:MAG: hypothetical protein OQJ78_05790 [Ignavibacteriaceae bacterium]|nr:hypothetical protein [Ignavibacteriaceae bacterium]
MSPKNFLFFFFISCTSCHYVLDPNTESVALCVGELTAAFFLRSADKWAELEKNDGDIEWKDAVADLWLALRKGYNLTDGEVRLVEHEVQRTLKNIILHRPYIKKEAIYNDKTKILQVK